jgi:hypothetical protein
MGGLLHLLRAVLVLHHARVSLTHRARPGAAALSASAHADRCRRRTSSLPLSSPRFVKVEPPTDADIADVVQKISRRTIRTLRHLGYLEAGIDAAVAPGYDPLVDDEAELARTWPPP